MKEDFLHFVWKFQKWNTQHLTTVTGEDVVVVHPGQHNFNSGPDFFNAQLVINQQKWAGNVEIHLKSSDWFAHHHERDAAYDNVILHVVWEHDTEVYHKNSKPIDTLVINTLVDEQALKKYSALFAKLPKFINCENDLASVDDFTIKHWLERLYLERLQHKSESISQQLAQTKNHWEALLFQLLCRNFGLNINGQSFFSIASSVDFSTLQKCGVEAFQLEALLFGQAGLLEKQNEDAYFLKLKEKYQFLSNKFNLKTDGVIPPKFFRLRPPNFPTIRLSQLAMLYTEKKQLFSTILQAETLENFYTIFNCKASDYWDTHYNFGVTSKKRSKRVSKKFINLLLINTVIPIKFCYAQSLGKDISEELLTLASSISKEENIIVKKFNNLKEVADNAMDSQALLQLKKEYCTPNKCLNCAIGNSLLTSS